MERAEVEALVRELIDGSDLNVRVRQLQGRDADGFYNGTWPGGVSVLQVTVPHTLGRVPTKLWVTGQADEYTARLVVAGTDEQNAKIEVRHWNNAVQAVGTVLAFSWLLR